MGNLFRTLDISRLFGCYLFRIMFRTVENLPWQEIPAVCAAKRFVYFVGMSKLTKTDPPARCQTVHTAAKSNLLQIAEFP